MTTNTKAIRAMLATAAPQHIGAMAIALSADSHLAHLSDNGGSAFVFSSPTKEAADATRALMAALPALLGELDEARRLLADALPLLPDAVQSMYGGFHGGDPRNFHPDPDCSTEEERANWRKACADFTSAEARGEHPVLGDTHSIGRTEDGRFLFHVACNPFGLGTYTYREPALDAIHERIRAALEATKEPE